jgi:hypothetical protein
VRFREMGSNLSQHGTHPEADAGPRSRYQLLSLEELLQPPVPLEKKRLPIAPSTLWKRRTLYVRGARPLHCNMNRRESAPERKQRNID